MVSLAYKGVIPVQNARNARKPSSSVSALFFIVVFTFSFYFSSAYQLGDQVHYRAFYYDLQTASIDQILFLQLVHIGSSEPLYGLIAWLGAYASIDKDVYFSIINALLCLFLLKFLIKNSANIIYITLVFVNFYLLVLMGSAERLKVSFLFVVLAATTPSYRARYMYLFAGLLSHFQNFILVGSRLVGLIPKVFVGNADSLKSVALASVGIVLVLTFYNWLPANFLTVINDKFEAYKNNHGILAIKEIVILTVIAIVVLRHKFEAILTFMACGVAASVLGPERVNMIAFILFSYYTVLEHRTNHPLVIAMMFYFAVKGLLFVFDVITRGTGF